MIIHLFKNGSAMITGKNTRTVSTVPEASGVLDLGETKIRVDGACELEEELIDGMRSASFTGDDGKVYAIGTVTLRHGRAVSLNAESDFVIDILHRMEGLEEKYDELSDKYQKLKAKVEYDSIGFITGDGEA